MNFGFNLFKYNFYLLIKIPTRCVLEDRMSNFEFFLNVFWDKCIETLKSNFLQFDDVIRNASYFRAISWMLYYFISNFPEFEVLGVFSCLLLDHWLIVFLFVLFPLWNTRKIRRRNWVKHFWRKRGHGADRQTPELTLNSWQLAFRAFELETVKSSIFSSLSHFTLHLHAHLHIYLLYVCTHTHTPLCLFLLPPPSLSISHILTQYTQKSPRTNVPSDFSPKTSFQLLIYN